MRTDSTIRDRLGAGLLAELKESLWAVDCQTCDRPLGRRSPSVTVAAADWFAEVALHHRRCQATRWESADRLPRFGLHPTWRSGGFTVHDKGLFVFLVNPTCEVAFLVATDTGWRHANLDIYLAAGMEPGWPERMLPGLTGALNGDTLTIDLDVGGARLGSWSTGSLSEYAGAEIIRSSDAVLVGVTAAVDVTTGATPDLVQSLVDRGQVALAWAEVRTPPGVPASATGTSGPSVDVVPAVLAAVRGDCSLVAALRDRDDRMHAVLQVAYMLTLISSSSDDRSNGVHIVVPDEPTGQLLAEMGRPVLKSLGHTLVLLPAGMSPSRSHIVVGTPERFATRSIGPAVGALQAILLDVGTDALPPDFPHRYQRILEI